MQHIRPKRSFYHFTIFFLAFSFITLFVASIINLKIGIKIRYLTSFDIWFLTYGLVTIFSNLFLIIYYYHQMYWWATLGCLQYLFFSLCHLTVIYFMVAAQRLESYYHAIYLCMLSSMFLYGLTLSISKTNYHKWLRWAGVLLILVSLLFIAASLGASKASSYEMRETIGLLHNALTVIGSLVSIPLIAHFWEELKQVKEPPKKTRSLNLFGQITIGLFIFATLFLLVKDAFQNNLKYTPATQSQKEMASIFEMRSFTGTSGETLHYRLLRPLNYNADKKYPLAICLHHGGGNGSDNIRQIEAAMFARKLAEPANRQKYPAFLFVPQCPPGHSFGGIPNYSSIEDLVLEAMAALENEFNIDTSRRYVMGMSLGGFGTWNLIAKNPQMFAAAMPVCGGGDPDLAEVLVNMPIWAFHGAEDTNVPTKLSRDMIQAIRAKGGKPKYLEFEGVGHAVWSKVNDTEEKLPWLFSQKRK